MPTYVPGLTRAAAPRILAIALALATAGGAVAAISATASAKPATRATPPPVPDHQLCYTAKVPVAFKIPRHVVLVNQFNPSGFRPTIMHAVLLCNPVVKKVPTATFRVKNPRAHLVCFAITGPKAISHLVVVTNQFGSATLMTGQPNLLCLPSWKSLTAPPTERAAQPKGLSHFTCYPVQPVTGQFQPPQVMLKDEFARRPVGVKISPVPSELCLPTKKIIGRHVSKIVNPVIHLLCFPTSQTPIKRKVFVKNQFGRRTVRIVQTMGLCLPSHKTVVH